MATSFTVNKADLEYILKQIKISEATSLGYTSTPVSTLQAIMNAYGASAATAQQLPAGLRTVDGTDNNLMPGQSHFGAADTLFPRLTDPVYRNETAAEAANPDSIDFDGGGPAPALVQANYGIPGNVVDADPRIISNLIVDMSVNNPAAIAAYLGNPLSLEQFEADHPGRNPVAPGKVVNVGVDLEITNTDLQTIPNQSPDIGLSPGFNAWMTFFGQFFDHGLDLVTKGNNGTVYVPLQPDDPLIAGPDGIPGNGDDLLPEMRFMALTRATPTIVDGVPQHENTTTSFVDQNQTYTSHPSHQVFLREYTLLNGKAVSTGKMLDGSVATGSKDHAIGNWADVKKQASTMLGIVLKDSDVLNVPLLATDQYGKFIPGAHGFAQLVMPPDAAHPTGNWLLEGTAGGLAIPATALRTNHAFLNDLAHNAVPGTVFDTDGNPATPGTSVVVADADNVAGNAIPMDFMGRKTAYDDELLDLHMITGDGRGNENIALTTVHSIFHSEHNRLVDVNQATILASGDMAFINEWLLTDLTAAEVAAIPTDPTVLAAYADTLAWDGERLFQAARFGTEMQYQHLVFEEFARRIQPMVDPFIFNNSPNIDPSIVAEFAHTVYRFGHSMLTGTVDRLENDLTTVNGDMNQKTLLAVFLNPQAYIGSGATLEQINANIIRGLSRDVGNAMDEFIVTDVRSNLLGLPLDLAVLNLARGRETGIPSLNQTREQLYNDTGLADLKPYDSWHDFALNIKNAASVVNFIAAYGTHESITGANTLAEKRAAAELLVFGDNPGPDGKLLDDPTTVGVDESADNIIAPSDRIAFLNATGAWAPDGAAGPHDDTRGGLNLIDLWIGGLAEKNPEFGGMLGTTFNYVFEFQMESLQFGDRMYYLTRTQGLNFLNNLEPNTFSDLVMRNTELGDIYSTHLNGALFTTPDHFIELDRGIAQTDYNGVELGKDPLWDGSNPTLEAILGPKVVRDYTGATTVTAAGAPTPPAIDNGSFEQDSLATGQPGVFATGIGNYTYTAPTGWTISGQGGMYAPSNAVSSSAGHTGSNVVWLGPNGMLSKNTGVSLVEGATYTVNFKVGDRTDFAWPGGTARLMASDGINPAVVLATIELPTPAEGQWSDVMLTTPSITAVQDGYALYFEVQQGDGSSNQVLVDNVSIVADFTAATVTVAHDVGGYLRVQGGEHYVLGGTEGNDIIYGDSGIDTLWGDGGNDYLNGGIESDDVFGGEGDDIIEDPFGDDVLRGNQGNDVITSARGADLLFGDQGTDYIVLGQDAGEVFGGTGGDFILGGDGKDFLLGNEGDDWIEGGAGFDTIAGENSELFFNSPIIGHDVLFGQGDETDYDAESGDDIMTSAPSVFRYEGMFGFDWGIGKMDVAGVNFDLQIPIFTTIPNDVLRDRFDQVEALSGWTWDDHLDGDDRGHKGGGSSAPDSIPVVLFADHLLTQEGINRIDGFNTWFGGARETLFGAATPIPGTTALATTTYRDGNILMGGDGNDFLRGRGGYDMLDGDAWLNVRIKIVHNGVTYSAESLSTDTTVAGEHAGKVYNTFTSGPNAGSPNFASVAFDGRSLTSLMLDRTLNPGELSIVREIQYDTTPSDNVDTAIFQGTLAEYDIEGRGTMVGGVEQRAYDLNGDGFISVRDRDTGAIGATVIVDGVEVVLSSRGALTDDLDLLKNVERLQFADQTITIAGNNAFPTGVVTINDPTMFDPDGAGGVPSQVTPYVGQVLTASLIGISSSEAPLGPDGLPVGLTFEWQTTELGSNAGWSTITTGLSYTVRPVDPGHVLRAVAVFKDTVGVTERIASEATDGATVAFFVNENSPTGTLVSTAIPFSVDYDPLLGAADGDIVTLTHVMAPGGDAGGRFKIVSVGGVDQLQVANGALLDYEALQTPVDNQYQIVINSYIDAASAAAADPAGLLASRQFTVLLGDINPEGPAPTPPSDINWNGVRPVSETALPLAGVTIANLSTVDPDALPGTASYLKVGGDANMLVSSAGVVTSNNNLAQNTTYVLNVQSTDSSGASTTEVFNIRTGTTGSNTINGSGLTDIIYGLGGNDTLNGAGGNDTLFGQDGTDTLNGGAGDDDLTGGNGNDTINGEAGNDTIRYTLGDDDDVVDGGDNTDTLVITGTTGGDTLDAVFDGTAITEIEGGGSIANVESITANLLGGTDTLDYDNTTADVTVNLTTGTASGFTSITGIENASGDAGNDTLIGLAGQANLLTGGAGNDTFTVHDLTDTIHEANNGGTDTVLFSSAVNGQTYTLTDLDLGGGDGTSDVENLTLLGSANLNGTGNAVANVITGNSGNNVLNGADGDDTLIGGLGNDTLSGGNQIDTASYADHTTGVTVSLAVAAAQDLDGGGVLTEQDTLVSIENLTGSAQGDTLTGSTAANVLSGSGGNDTLIATVDNVRDTMDGGANTDTANYAAYTAALTVDLGGAAPIVVGGSGSNAANSDVVVSIENFVGGSGNDTLTGSTAANILNAGGGNDTIIYNMGGGADTIDGGAGTGDTLNIVGTAASEALDVIWDGTAITQVEGGTVTGIESVTANLQGNGGTGDTLSYTGTLAANGVTVNLATGAASGFSSITNFENATGGSGVDHLTGSGTANALNGGIGADILIGGGGADAINMGVGGDNAQDVARFGANTEYGDSITNFDADGTAAQIDMVQFAGALNTLLDDGTADDNIAFVSGNNVNGGNTAVNLNGTNEALYLSGANGEGVSSDGGNDLDSATAVAAEFNSEFAITAAAGEATLLVINDTNANSAAVWQYVENGTTAEIQTNELTLVGLINANATVTTGSFDFTPDETNFTGTGIGETLTGDGGDNTMSGLGGNDTINGNAGNDTIIQTGATDGRDFVDGGAGLADTYQLNGVAAVETFKIYTRAEALSQIASLVLNVNTEIVVTRQPGNVPVGTAATAGQVIAELDNIEEITVNTLGVSANDGNGAPNGGTNTGDTIQIIGNFNAPATSLNFSTITIDGNAGDDTIDISALTSAHRIVFRSNGGNDTIIGNMRPQDVIDLPAGATAADYTTTTGTNGVSTMTNGTHSVTFTAPSGMPQVGYEDDEDDDSAGNDDDDDNAGNDDADDTAGGDDDEDDEDDNGGTETNTPVTGVVRTGTPQADVLAGVAGDDNIVAFAGDDVATGGAGADAISAGEGADFVNGGDGRDVIIAGAGDDQVFGGGHADVIYGDAGADRIFGEGGNDLINAGAGDDAVFGGAGDDLIVAEIGDGNDVYFGDDSDGGTGTDTLDMSAATANVTVNLGSGPMSNGTASSSQTGNDTVWGVENVNTGSGNDTIIANNAANVMKGGAGNDTYKFTSASAADGDTILGFEPGDRVDLTAIDANLGAAGDQSFTLVSAATFSAAGQLAVTYETRADGDFTVVQGNTGGNTDADFTIEIEGHHNMTNANLGL